MSTSHLVVLPKPEALESPGDKIRRLQLEARVLAFQHLEQLKAALDHVARLSGEISEGGELYPVGARELARRMTDEVGKLAFTLEAVIERA